MSHKLPSYVRTNRKGWALTQAELAKLLGDLSPKYLSRIERDQRPPNVRILIGCCLIFGRPPNELFPALWEKIEGEVVSNLYLLYEELQADESPRGRRKVAIVEAALTRTITSSINTKEV